MAHTVCVCGQINLSERPESGERERERENCSLFVFEHPAGDSKVALLKLDRKLCVLLGQIDFDSWALKQNLLCSYVIPIKLKAQCGGRFLMERDFHVHFLCAAQTLDLVSLKSGSDPRRH
jgi:hypothetical protein